MWLTAYMRSILTGAYAGIRWLIQAEATFMVSHPMHAMTVSIGSLGIAALTLMIGVNWVLAIALPVIMSQLALRLAVLILVVLPRRGTQL